MLSLLPSMFVLGLAAFAALSLARSRRSPPENTQERLAAARALAMAVGIQSVHFTEAVVGGFHERLGALLGLPGMPLSFFVVSHLAWIGILVASVPGLRSLRPPAFFAGWFLAIAGMFNGIAHPLLAIAAGGYFPGLITSPFIGIAGIWLWRRLHEATRPKGVTDPAYPPCARRGQDPPR